jgi:glycerol kinase
LSRATTRGHIARAVFEGIAFRVREAADAIRTGTDLPPLQALRVDGGVARSDVLLQIQADVLGIPLERFAIPEATAMGAAIAAGAGAGWWDLAGAAQKRSVDTIFTPTWSDDEREGRFARWRTQCATQKP